MPDLVNPNNHAPGEVNTGAWDRAAQAKRIVQARKVAKATDSREAVIELHNVTEEATKSIEASVQAQIDRQALGQDMGERLAERPLHDDQFLDRLKDLGDLKPGSAKFMKKYLRGTQAPEVVQFSYVQQGEGLKRVSRLWAVDSNDIDCIPRLMYNKHAGDEMTDAEYAAVCKAQRAVNWDKDGNPTDFRPIHDSREFESDFTGRDRHGNPTVNLTEATSQEREAAKQYATTGFIPGGVGGDEVPPTEHVILPDPPNVEDWNEYSD
jgi:hypothetical protein